MKAEVQIVRVVRRVLPAFCYASPMAPSRSPRSSGSDHSKRKSPAASQLSGSAGQNRSIRKDRWALVSCETERMPPFPVPPASYRLRRRDAHKPPIWLCRRSSRRNNRAGYPGGSNCYDSRFSPDAENSLHVAGITRSWIGAI